MKEFWYNIYQAPGVPQFQGNPIETLKMAKTVSKLTGARTIYRVHVILKTEQEKSVFWYIE